VKNYHSRIPIITMHRQDGSGRQVVMIVNCSMAWAKTFP
jgi:hypothetical protein